VSAELSLDTIDDAGALIGRRANTRRGRALIEATPQPQSDLVTMLARRPLDVLDVHDV
jgi:hypothetical protein